MRLTNPAMRVVVALVSLVFLVADGIAQDEGAWRELIAEFDKTFQPLPVKKLFSDPIKELKLSRRAPYTGAKRTELKEARAKARLAQEQILAKRKEREGILMRIGTFGGDAAAKRLIRAWEMQQDNVAAAQKNLDRYTEASRIDINPGVDPGGVYWERWMRKDGFPVARRALNDEKTVGRIALEEATRLLTEDVREWLIGHATSHPQPEVRETMIGALAKSGTTESIDALAALFAGAREPWVRVAVLLTLGEQKSARAGPVVVAALAHEDWPVRAAAIRVLRDLGLRDRAVVGALVRALPTEDGRLLVEMRDALVEATGETYGLRPDEWELWWAGAREGWTAPAKASAAAPLPEKLPRLCGVPVASKRVAFLVSRGQEMLAPTKRRKFANDGTDSPDPEVDTRLRVAAWEIGEALKSLPEDALFTVIAYDSEASVWSKKLRPPTTKNIQGVQRFLAKKDPQGASRLSAALEAALLLGVAKRVDDLALAGVGDVDTIYVVGGAMRGVGSLGGTKVGGSALSRVTRLRRVIVRGVDPAAK